MLKAKDGTALHKDKMPETHIKMVEVAIATNTVHKSRCLQSTPSKQQQATGSNRMTKKSKRK